MSVIQNNLLMTPEGYQISRSVRLRSSAGGFFNRTPSSSGNRKTFTWSGWVKRGNLGSINTLFSAGLVSSTYYYSRLYFDANNNLVFINYPDTASIQATTAAVFRDPSAYYHVALSVDTTQATNSNGIRIWVNGVQQTLTFAAYTQNADTMFNTTSYTDWVGKFVTGAATDYFDGYLTEVNFIDGQALTPSSFGEYNAITGVWQPKKYAGTYGTNGFYLNFSDNSAATAAAIGKDYSGNGNSWTPNNISVTAGATYDSMLDVPTMWADGGNGRGNYCVMNTLDKNANVTISDGNLSFATSAVNYGARATVGINSGKWYWEATVVAVGSTNVGIGVAQTGSSWDLTYVGSGSSSWSYFSSGQKYNAGAGTAYGATFTTGDVIGVAFDADAGTLTFYKNNVSQGQAFSGVSGSSAIHPALSGQTSSSMAVNFGQRPFTYTPPTGFKALNTQNLPEATIAKGSTAFNIALDTGANIKTSTEALFSGSQYLEWIKDRANANNHQLLDTVRGTTSVLQSNTTAAETTYSAPSGNSVGWAWKESIAAGFDIVTYTGNGSTQNVSHSLGVAPKMMIVKRRDSSTNGDWFVYTATTGNTSALYLNLTAAVATGQVAWNSTTPTSSVFSVGNSTGVNASGSTYVAYLFAEVAGFSKFGSYTGNGSADGPFVYCGFRPRYVMIKRTTGAATDWEVHDTARNTYNVTDITLRPNSSSAEFVYAGMDITANGFKLRDTSVTSNSSGDTFIFAAFAESPFKNSLAR